MMDPSSSSMGMHSSTNTTSGGGGAGNGNGSGSNAAGGSQSSSTPQSRARVTVVCAECKRLKLKCDRRAPCGSCLKRDTVARCQYSAAAAEKVDIHSVNNRLLNVESHLNIVSNGQFQSSYPPANLTGGAATSTTSGNANPTTSTASNASSYAPSWPPQPPSQSQGQSNQHISQHTMLPHPSHPHTQMHTHAYPPALLPQPGQAQHFAATLPRTLDPLHDALNISDDVLESVWVGPLEGILSLQAQGQGDGQLQGTEHPKVKQESNGEFDFLSSSSAPVQSTSASGSSASSTITPTPIQAAGSIKQNKVSLSTASRHLPAFSIYIPPPEIGVPGSSSESAGAFPFGGAATSASASGAAESGMAGEAQTQAKAQVTPGLLRLLPSPERCEMYLRAAGDVVGVRGVLLDPFSSSSSPKDKDAETGHKGEKKSNDGMKRFRARAIRLISSSSSSTTASRRTHTRPVSRTSSIASVSSSSSSSGSDSEDPDVGGLPEPDAELEAETQQEKEAREARERKARARQIYFKGVTNPPPILSSTSTRPPVARRKLGKSREAGESKAKDKNAKHTEGTIRDKDRDGLTFFAMVCAALAIGAHRVEVSSSMSVSTSSTGPTPSPLFLYALSQQALGVWDTAFSSSDSDSTSQDKERIEYLQACLLGLQVLIDVGGEESRQDGEAREGVRSLITKLVSCARALGIDQEISFVGRRARLEVQQGVNAKRREKEEKREQMKRCLWWECVWWDMLTSDTYAFQPCISLNAYSTQLPACAASSPSGLRRSSQMHIDEDQDLHLIEMTDDAEEYDELMESGGDGEGGGLFDEFVAVPKTRTLEQVKGKEKKEGGREMSEQEKYAGAKYRLTQLIHSIKKRTSDASSFFAHAPSPMSMASLAADAYAPTPSGVNVMPPPMIGGSAAVYCSSYTLDQASALEEALRSWTDNLPVSLQVPSSDADDVDGDDNVNIDPALAAISSTSTNKDMSKMHAYELSILANLAVLHIWVPFLRQQGSKPLMASQSCVAAAQGLVGSLKGFSSMSSSASASVQDTPLPATLALISPLKVVSNTVIVLSHSALVGRDSRRARERTLALQDLKDAMGVYDVLGGRSLIGRMASVVDAVRKRIEGLSMRKAISSGAVQSQQTQVLPQVQVPAGTKRKHAEVDYSSTIGGAAANFHIVHPHLHPGGVGSGVSGTSDGHGAAAVSNADGISSGSAPTTTTTGYDYSTLDAGYYDPSVDVGHTDYTSHSNAEQMQYEVQQQQEQEHQQQQYLQNAIGVAQQQPQSFNHVEGGLVGVNMMGDVEVHHPQPRVESHDLHELQHGQPQLLSSHRTATPALVASSRPHSAHPQQHHHPHAHRPYDPRDRPNRHAPEQHSREQHHHGGTGNHRDKEGGKKSSSGNSSSGSGSSTGSYPSKGIRKRDGRAVPRKEGVLHLNPPNVSGDVGGREGTTSRAIMAMKSQRDIAANALGLSGSVIPSGLTTPSPHPVSVSMPMHLSNPIPIHAADAPMSTSTSSSALGNHNILSMSMPLVESPLSMDQAQSHPDLMNASVYSRSRSSSLSHVQHASTSSYTHQSHTQTPRIEYTTVPTAPAPPVFGTGVSTGDQLQPPRKRQTLEVPVPHHRGQHQHMSPQPPQFGSQYTSPGGFDNSASGGVDGSSNNNAYNTGNSPFSTASNSPYAGGHHIPLASGTPTFTISHPQNQTQHQKHAQHLGQHIQQPQPTPPTFGPGPLTPSSTSHSSSTSGMQGQQVRSGSQSQNQSASQSPVNYFNSPSIAYGPTNSSLDDPLSLSQHHSIMSMSIPSTPVYEKHGGFDTYQHRQMGYQNSQHELGLGHAMDMDVSGVGYEGVGGGVEHSGQQQQQMVDWSSTPGTTVSTGLDGGTGTRETFWEPGYY